MRQILEFIKLRLWAATQFPRPDLVARHGGMPALVNYLKQCGSPDLIKRILTDNGADIHPDAQPIGPWITVHEASVDFSNLTIGAHAHVGKEVFLDLSDRIIIEKSVAVGMRSIILTHLNLGEGYPDKPTAKLIPTRRAPTILRRGCSVGAGSVILCGVEVGEDAVINAGVVVDQDVPARTIVTSSRTRAPYTMPEKFFAKVSSGTG